jgi:MFS family permease
MVTNPLRSDFAKLWTGLSVSVVGTEITALALPVIAAVTLEASPLEMGILAGLGQAPFLLFSLPAGAWVDRLRRRRVLISCDVGSALLLLSIPIAALFDGLSYVQLCAVAFGVGTFQLFFDIAHYAYVPALVGRGELTRFNSRLQVSHSAAAAGGPGLGGVLIQLLSAPIAVLIDAISFLCSAFLLSSIRKTEAPIDSGESTGMLRAVRDGLRMLLGHRLLRPIMVISVPIGFFGAGVTALYILYATRELGLSPLVIGAIFAAGGVAALPGAVLAERAGRRFGVGRTILGGYAIVGVAALCIPLAAGPTAVVIGVLVLGRVLDGLSETVANIHQWTLRQAVTPDRLAGRVTAGHRFIVYGACALGAFASGALGSLIGVRATLAVFAIGIIVSPLLAVSSALVGLREQPADVDGDAIADVDGPRTHVAAAGAD